MGPPDGSICLCLPGKPSQWIVPHVCPMIAGRWVCQRIELLLDTPLEFLNLQWGDLTTMLAWVKHTERLHHQVSENSKLHFCERQRKKVSGTLMLVIHLANFGQQNGVIWRSCLLTSERKLSAFESWKKNLKVNKSLTIQQVPSGKRFWIAIPISNNQCREVKLFGGFKCCVEKSTIKRSSILMRRRYTINSYDLKLHLSKGNNWMDDTTTGWPLIWDGTMCLTTW